MCVMKCTNNQFIFNNSICVFQCPSDSGYYSNYTSYTCERCHSTCRSCSAGPLATDCTICAVDRYFNSSMYCVDLCPKGTFPSLATGSCELCHSTCATCTQYSLCTLCVVPLMLDGTDCLQQCPENKYYDQLLSACKPCHSYCKAC